MRIFALILLLCLGCATPPKAIRLTPRDLQRDPLTMIDAYFRTRLRELRRLRRRTP